MVKFLSDMLDRRAHDPQWRIAQNIFPAIDVAVAHPDGCSPSWSDAIRTARARTSRLNLFVVLLVMAPSDLEVGASAKPGAVHFSFTLQIGGLGPLRVD